MTIQNTKDYSFDVFRNLIKELENIYKEDFKQQTISRADWNIYSKYVSFTSDKSISYRQFSITDSATYKELLKMLSDDDAMIALKEGTSLAFYRAYVLASGLTSYNEKPLLQTNICNDIWGGRVITSTPAFGLLRNLFNDKIEAINEMYSETKEEMAQFLKDLSETGTVKSGGDTFESHNFAIIKSPLCKQKLGSSPKTLINIDDEEKIEKVKEIFKAIAAELMNHIKNIEKVMNELIDLKAFVSPDSRLIIRPVFFTDKEGAMKALEKIIKKARDVLKEHYLKVERYYAEGVKAIDPEAEFVGASETKLIEDR
jgi:hypothetical protein